MESGTIVKLREAYEILFIAYVALFLKACERLKEALQKLYECYICPNPTHIVQHTPSRLSISRALSYAVNSFQKCHP